MDKELSPPYELGGQYGQGITSSLQSGWALWTGYYPFHMEWVGNKEKGLPPPSGLSCFCPQKVGPCHNFGPFRNPKVYF